MVLHRPPHYGCLDLQSVKYKALAGFISTFLQTADNPAFIFNLLHSLLYRKFILEEEEVPGAPHQLPPYFSQEFFDVIKNIKNKTTLNISTLTEKDWCRLLTEEYITMDTSLDDNPVFHPCKAELASPDTDWSISWSLCRQQGLSPELSSFLWKLLLDLLCTQQKLHKMGANISPLCKLCKDQTGSLQHELLDCSLNDNTGLMLLSTMNTYIPSITPVALLHVELGDLESELQLPATLLVAVTLACIWKERHASSRAHAYQI